MIRFATIGTNKIVDSFLAGAKHDPRFKYEATYSRNIETGETFAAKYGVKRVFTSLEDLAAAEKIDAVYIASPNICHFPHSTMMMEHGKHVLCEKPLATTFDEGLQMVECARKHRVSFMEAMKTTLLPNFGAVKDALQQIGEVRRYFAQFCQYSSRYDNFKKGIIMNAFRPELGNGAMVDLGVYGIAPMVHLFGVPETVTSSSTFLHTGVDGQGTIIMSYPTMEATIIYSKISDSTIPSEIQGEGGRIVINKLSDMIGPHIIYRDGTKEDISLPTISDNMYYEVKEFIDMIEQGAIESSINTFQRSLDVLTITDKCKNE
jgi:scyllo-inositol 2-dehydrogenase (NADP+)